MLLTPNVIHAVLLLPMTAERHFRLLFLGALVLTWLVFRNEDKIEEWFEPRCNWNTPDIKPVQFKQYRYKAALPILNFVRSSNGN